MKVFYKILPEYEIIIQKYVGEFSIEDYKNAAERLINTTEWKNVKKSLLDLREVTTNKSVELVEELIKVRIELNIQKRQTVYIVNTPLATVLTHLYIENIPDSNYTYCTTTKKALSILFLESISSEIEEIFYSFK